MFNLFGPPSSSTPTQIFVRKNDDGSLNLNFGVNNTKVNAGVEADNFILNYVTQDADLRVLNNNGTIYITVPYIVALRYELI